MTKKNWLYVLCSLSISFVIVNASELIAWSSLEQNVSIQINDVRKHGNVLTLVYQIENPLEQPIWVCVENDFTQQNTHREMTVDKEKGGVFLRIDNPQIPPNIYFSIPLAKTFTRIASKERRYFDLQIEFPGYNNISYQKDDTQKKLPFKELLFIEIKLGFYDSHDQETFPLKKDQLNNNNIVLDCYWAKEHPSKTISFRIENKIIQKFLRKENTSK